MIVLPKANTTPVTKKILVMCIGSKNPRRFTLCSGLIGLSAPEIQVFLMDMIIHPQIFFSKPIQPATLPIKKNVMIYTLLASDKAIYLPRKLQHVFEMTRVLIKG